jgi:hypothetical protein
MFHPERAQDPIPEAEQQMCAHDVDPEATQELVFRVPVEVASLFFAVRETLRAKLRGERARSPSRPDNPSGANGPDRPNCANGPDIPNGANGPHSPSSSESPDRRPLARFVTDGEVFEALLDCALLAWTLRDPAARRPDPVFARDGWRCAVPGCTSRCSLHDHHVIFRSAGGSEAAENRVALCAFHHQRCLHAGLLGVSGRAPDALVFELGLRSGGAPLVRYRSGDITIPQGEAHAAPRPRRAA